LAVHARAREKVRQARQEAYRGLILEAAERIFGQKGYGPAKVAEIAEAAGVATGTVYASFPGKEDLYRAVHQECLAELARRYEAIPSQASVRETILARSEVSTRFLASRPDYLRMYLREAAGWGFAASDLPADARAFVDLPLYERGIASGELVDEDPLLLTSLQQANSQVHLTHWLENGMRQTPDELVARIQSTTRRTLFRDRAA
jgi:AcrR family transcriptional regulator